MAITPYTLREWLKAGKIHGIQVSRRWRVPERELSDLATKRPDDAMTSWAHAAARMAPVYADSIEAGDELTASTTRGGAYVPTGTTDEGGTD